MFSIAWLFVLLWNVTIYLIPSSWLWGYNYIQPVNSSYEVWGPVSFNTDRYENFDLPVKFTEFVYCTDGIRKISITDTYIVDWVYKKGNIKAQFTYWWNQVPILLPRQWSGCYLQSCQDVVFLWKVKTQCFTSNPPFDIIWE